MTLLILRYWQKNGWKVRKNVRMTENEAIELHIAETTYRIKVIEDFLRECSDADVKACKKNIEILTKVNTALQEIRQPSKWILCSEYLPDHEGQVLVQVSGKFKNTTFDNAFELAEYDKNEGWILETFPEWGNPDVIAWQLLPEPYEKEKDIND